MKNINIPSVIIGALSSLLVISLISAKRQDTTQPLQIFSHETGVAIFNSQSHTLSYFRTNGYGENARPLISYQVSPDGKALIEIVKDK